MKRRQQIQTYRTQITSDGLGFEFWILNFELVLPLCSPGFMQKLHLSQLLNLQQLPNLRLLKVILSKEKV